MHQPANFDPVPEALRKKLEQRLALSHVGQLFDFKIEDLRLDYCNLSLAYREEITNGAKSRGTIHGGIVSTLADTACAFALATNFEGRMSFATVDLHVNFVARAQTKIFAHAAVIRKGSRIQVCDVRVVDEIGKLVATASLNFILTKPIKSHDDN